MKLTKDDYATLERSYITPQIADAAALYRLPSIEARELVGRRGGGDYSGIVFPYRLPGNRCSVLDRLRLDSPPVDAATGKPEHKYLTAFGSRNRLYFPPPPCDPAFLTDVIVPAVITEGEKKVLALWRVALESTNGTGKPAFLPFGPAGAWGWKGVVGTLIDSKGKRVPEKGVIPDLDLVACKGRRMTILYDVNAATNTSVAAGRRELARELNRRGAEVWLADLPPLAGVNGVDDLLGLFGLEKALEVLKSATRYQWRDELIVSDKGKILPLLANVVTTLRSAPEWCGLLAFDEHRRTVATTRDTPWGPVESWEDHHTTLLVNWLQHHGIRTYAGDAHAAVEAVARDRSFHPVREFFASLIWDGVGRLDGWLTLYLGAESSDLTRAIGVKWLISAVARIFEPGCQADHVLILEGPQGQGKSSGIRILGEPFYSDDIAELGTKDASLGTSGAWIIELSDLDAMTRAEVAKIKAFVTRRTDRFRPPYGRRMVEVHRQSVFAGTVNHNEYLKDETGARRFWPVACGQINLDALRRDRDQLLAEAIARYRNGESWWLTAPELIREATFEQEDRYLADPWEGVIADWLEKPGPDLERRSEVTTADVLQAAIHKETGQWTRGDETRVGMILRRLNWDPGKRPRVGSRRRLYMPRSKGSDEPTGGTTLPI